MATVYAVASAKGGVGKTTTTAAMATILAGSGADVVAVDADIGMANLAGALGVTPGETTLHDVLAGRADPLDAVHEGPEGLRVVPGSDDLDAYASADPAGLTDAVAAFDDADYVFVDAGAGLSHDSSLPLAIADETLLVSTVERSALGDTEKTRQLAERLGGSVAGAALTRVAPDADSDENGADGLGDLTDVLDAAILGRIPEDDAVVRAAAANRPLPTFAPDAPATRAYRDLTQALTGAAIEGAESGESGDDAESAEGGDADDVEGTGETLETGGDDETDDVEVGSEGDDAEEALPDSDAEETAADEDTEEAPTDADANDEEIIVADAEARGLSDPGGEEEVIVADEDTVSEAEETAAPGETETVGEGHVDGDDLEEMIEDDETEAFDDAETDDAGADEPEGAEADDAEPEDAEADDAESEDAEADDTGPEYAEVDDAESIDSDDDESAAGGVDEGAPGDTAEATADDDTASARSAAGRSADPDDELAGSVPFRDDDTGTRSAGLSEGDEDAAESKRDPAADDETGGDEKESRGFFSRLFGR